MGRGRRELCVLFSRVLGIILGLEEGAVYTLFLILYLRSSWMGQASAPLSSVQFSSVHFSHSVVSHSHNPMYRSMPGLPVQHQLQEFTQTHVHWVGDAIQPSHPLSSPSLLPPIPPSIRVFSNESNLRMRWPKYWSFSFSIIPSKEIPGLIFRMDWLDLLAVQGMLKSLLSRQSNVSAFEYTI